MARLGHRIVELREDRALAQEELAELARVSPRTMQRIEAGEANLSVERLYDVATALSVELQELFAPPSRPIVRRPGRPTKRG